MVMQAHSKAYLKWAETYDGEPLTNSQVAFVEFLLSNKSELAKPGLFDHLLNDVRKYLKQC